MPVRYVIDKERRLVISTVSDPITFAEIKAAQNQLANDPDFNPDFNHLIDTSAMTKMEILVEQAKEMAQHGIFSSVSRGAIIAPTPSVFGMGRLFEAHHDIQGLKDEVRVFYERDEALKWLGLGLDSPL